MKLVSLPEGIGRQIVSDPRGNGQVVQRFGVSDKFGYQGGPDTPPTNGSIDKDLKDPKDGKHTPKKQVSEISWFGTISGCHPEFSLRSEEHTSELQSPM